MSQSAPKVWQDPWHFMAFGHGSGLAPIAPGTFGSAVGLIYYLIFYALGWPAYICLTLLATLFGIWLCGRVSADLGVHDHGGIVWDEIVGILLTFMWVEVSISNIIVGFVLFRIFDIVKPWPIKVIDKSVKGGLGIMLDDVLAAVPAWLCLQLYIIYLS